MPVITQSFVIMADFDDVTTKKLVLTLVIISLLLNKKNRESTSRIFCHEFVIFNDCRLTVAFSFAVVIDFGLPMVSNDIHAFDDLSKDNYVGILAG